MKSPTAFISYSWESREHKTWVKQLAKRLRRQGIAAVLDQWETAPGDQLTSFMERAVRESDFVIAICTPAYKKRADRRVGGVGYEGDIMTAEVFSGTSRRKFIPVLRDGSWISAAPTWLQGCYYIDLRGSAYSERAYADMLDTLLGRRPEPPPVGSAPAPFVPEIYKDPFKLPFGKPKKSPENPVWGDGDGVNLIPKSQEIRWLAKAHPEIYEPLLVATLVRVAKCLNSIGDNEGAVKAMQEAVEVRRRLSETSQAGYDLELAENLERLSRYLRTCYGQQGALEAIQESVDIYRRLAMVNPSRFDSDLATTLCSLSDSLVQMQNAEAAVQAAEEAVAIHRHLSKINPSRFDYYLANSLGYLGYALRSNGRYAEAARVFKEGVDLMRPYAIKLDGGRSEALLDFLEMEIKRS